MGRLSAPKGLTRDISVDASGTVISWMPARKAEVMVMSLPSAPLAYTLAVILPPLRSDKSLAKWLSATPWGWSSLRPMPILNTCSLTWADTEPAARPSANAANTTDLNFMLVS